jgi:uncharacterized membrane protein
MNLETFASLHPALTGFPPVLIVLLVFVELDSLIRPGPRMIPIRAFLLLSLLIFLPSAYISGLLAEGYASRTFTVPNEAVNRHEKYAKILLCLCVPLIVLGLGSMETRWGKLAYRTVLLLALVMIFYVGAAGGSLVFEHGAGVTASPPR